MKSKDISNTLKILTKTCMAVWRSRLWWKRSQYAEAPMQFTKRKIHLVFVTLDGHTPCIKALQIFKNMSSKSLIDANHPSPNWSLTSLQEDYKNQVDKYCTVRDDFEAKMSQSAKHFQEVEGAHLKQMREFVAMYCQIVDNNNNQVGRVSDKLATKVCNLVSYFPFSTLGLLRL